MWRVGAQLAFARSETHLTQGPYLVPTLLKSYDFKELTQLGKLSVTEGLLVTPTWVFEVIHRVSLFIDLCSLLFNDLLESPQ